MIAFRVSKGTWSMEFVANYSEDFDWWYWRATSRGQGVQRSRIGFHTLDEAIKDALATHPQIRDWNVSNAT